MNAPVSIALSSFLALPAFAAETTTYSCAFQTECYDDECADSGYTADLIITPTDIAMIAEWTDPSEIIELTSHAAEERGTYLSDNRLLTLTVDGQARYTVHFADPISAITYIGACQRAQ